MNIEIRKLGYSANPWRVVIDGRELHWPKRFKHPVSGEIIVNMSVGGPTKSAAVQAALDLLGELLVKERPA